MEICPGSRIEEKGEFRGQTRDRPLKRPLTALSLFHPFSNRGHCSTFQPFNFSTAPKARRPFRRRATRFSIHFPLAARLGGAPWKSCPELSKLSQTSALQAHSESAKRFPCFLMQKTIVGNCRNCLTFLFSACFVGLFVLFVSRKRPENFFQSLENRRKIFPIIGKIGPNFPTIGKKFSNHWKTPLSPTGRRIGQNPGRFRGREGRCA